MIKKLKLILKFWGTPTEGQVPHPAAPGTVTSKCLEVYPHHSSHRAAQAMSPASVLAEELAEPHSAWTCLHRLQKRMFFWATKSAVTCWSTERTTKPSWSPDPVLSLNSSGKTKKGTGLGVGSVIKHLSNACSLGLLLSNNNYAITCWRGGEEMDAPCVSLVVLELTL